MSLDVRTKIIQRAASLFALNGIKGITMDDLATNMGMSKRTIYEHFKDKKELVYECISYYELLRDKDTHDIINSSGNMFEALLNLHQGHMRSMQKVNKKFIEDIRKYFPEINQRFIAKKAENVSKSKFFFQKGIDEGLIREELNPEILSVLLSEEMDLLFNGNSFSNIKFSILEVYKTVFLTFIRGIASDKGLEIINSFLDKNDEYKIN